MNGTGYRVPITVTFTLGERDLVAFRRAVPSSNLVLPERLSRAVLGLLEVWQDALQQAG